MAKKTLLFLPLFLTFGVSCFSTVERPLLKSNVDNSVDGIDFNTYTAEPSSYSYSKKPRYTVSFYSRVGNTELCVATRTILEGDKVTPPSDFENPGAVFRGWFLERECINLFNFNDSIYSDVDIFAKWEGVKNASVFYYSINGDDTCSVIGYNGKNNEISIPETYNGHRVTKIASEAFNSNKLITKVILPKTITSIGERAFYNCDQLTTIYLPRSLKSIETDAFDNCLKLNHVYYASTINKWPSINFSKSRSDSYVFNNAVNPFGYNTCSFYTLENDPGENSTIFITDYNYITPRGINFSSADNVCNDYCFYGLNQLETVSITNNDFTTIGNYSFAYCEEIKRFSINITGVKDSEKKKNKILGDGAFFRCPNLEEVTDSTYISKLAPYCFYDCNLTEFNFNNALVLIPAYSFAENDLRRLSFPDQYKVEIFGKSCFEGNSNLTEVGFRKVKVIERNAFHFCYKIEAVYYGGTKNEFYWFEIRGIYVPGNSLIYAKIQEN